MAKANATKHGVLDRVRFLSGDLLEPLVGETFYFIVSNPPYIPHEDMKNLAAGVRDYEPHLALDGGLGGFEVFERLIAQVGAGLVKGGYLLIEIGAPQEKGSGKGSANCRSLNWPRQYSIIQGIQELSRRGGSLDLSFRARGNLRTLNDQSGHFRDLALGN